MIDRITGASSISSSPSFLLSGVESLSGTSYGLSSSDISALFVNTVPNPLSLLIHVNNTSTSAYSPGFNNVFSNSLVDITLFPSSVHPGLSAATNFNPCGI